MDTKVILKNGLLTMALYKKDTDWNTLLRFDSCHPRKMVESLPYSQVIRAKRIIGEVEDMEAALDGMANDFRIRGYPQKLIDDQRQELLHRKKSD